MIGIFIFRISDLFILEIIYLFIYFMCIKIRKVSWIVLYLSIDLIIMIDEYLTSTCSQ